MEVNNYMIYGLVEIGLLVIGILIALQINNWNESRKEKQLEIQLFEAIINDLDLKRNELISDLDAGMKMIQKSDKIIHTWHNESPNNSTEIKYKLKLMGDDSWIHTKRTPENTRLSN
jgi:hypothetical protein